LKGGEGKIKEERHKKRLGEKKRKINRGILRREAEKKENGKGENKERDIYPSKHTVALGSTQPLTEMSTRNIPGGTAGP
jgi:hypothetical protein